MINEFNSWQDERLGVFTASRISDLLLKGRSKDEEFGQVAKTYIMEKVCELLTGETKSESYSKAIEWGNEHEAEAMAAYIKRAQPKEIVYFGKENPKCFSLTPELNLLGSPDGLIYGERVIEIKCPYNTVNHVENLMLDVEGFKRERKEYYVQIQVNMLVTDTHCADFVSFDPRMINRDLQLAILEIPKDTEFQELIKERVREATDIVREILNKIKMTV